MLTDDSLLAERVEAMGWADLMRACPDPLAGGLGLSIEQRGDAISSIVARIPVGMFNRSCGWREEKDWVFALDRHRRSGAPDYFLQPLPGETGFADWAKSQGLAHRSRWAKMIRSTDSPPKPDSALRITEGASHAQAFAAVAAAGFGMPPTLAPWLIALASRPGWRIYVGWDGEKAVSAAALRIHGNMAWCGLGATLAEYRGRGGQSAMFARRIADARDAGCRVVVTETGEDTVKAPNPSYRNMVRAGFRLTHFRDNWAPPKAS